MMSPREIRKFTVLANDSEGKPDGPEPAICLIWRPLAYLDHSGVALALWWLFACPEVYGKSHRI